MLSSLREIYMYPPPPIPPTQRHLWHFENAQCADMSNFLLDFPWNDYCFLTRDPDLVATAAGEVVNSGMREYIPYSLITFSPSNPWFDRACSSDREGAHRSYQASELTHATFISARNHCSAKIRRARSSFHKRKIDKLNSSPTEKRFWSLSPKIFNNFWNSSFPSLIRPDGSIACSPTDIKPISLVLTFPPILLSVIPMLLILLLNPSLTPSSSLLVKFAGYFAR